MSQNKPIINLTGLKVWKMIMSSCKWVRLDPFGAITHLKKYIKFDKAVVILADISVSLGRKSDLFLRMTAVCHLWFLFVMSHVTMSHVKCSPGCRRQDNERRLNDKSCIRKTGVLKHRVSLIYNSSWGNVKCEFNCQVQHTQEETAGNVSLLNGKRFDNLSKASRVCPVRGCEFFPEKHETQNQINSSSAALKIKSNSSNSVSKFLT